MVKGNYHEQLYITLLLSLFSLYHNELTSYRDSIPSKSKVSQTAEAMLTLCG